jgi:pimeloyl-ACP methyl ester carboxylesterase
MSIEGMAEVINELILSEFLTISANDLHLDSAADIAGAFPISNGVFSEHSFTESVVVIGHSMGGYISLAFAEKYSQKIKGLGLFHSTAYVDSEEKKGTRRKGIEFIKQHGAVEFLRATIPNLYYLKTKENNNYLIEEHLKNVSYFTESSLIAYYQSMMNRPDRTNILINSNYPVLFIAGKYDTAVPLQDIIEQTHMPDLTYIHILESSAHMGMVEQPELSSKILKEYLENTF